MIYTHFLPPSQFGRYGAWLKSLDSETLRSYFGIILGPKVIDRLMLKFKKDLANHSILVAEMNGQWVGTIHIASNKTSVEFGVIVHKNFRRVGIANQMLSDAILWSQNRHYEKLIMHCIVENYPIRQLCEKHGLIAKNIYGDVDVVMALPKANGMSWWREILQRQVNWYHLIKVIPSNVSNYKSVFKK